MHLWTGSTPLYVRCSRLVQCGSVDTIYRFFVVSTTSHKYATVVSLHFSLEILRRCGLIVDVDVIAKVVLKIFF